MNEIAMLSKYRHPNIVLLVGAVTSPPNLCIVMEYFKEGTLYDLLHRKKIQISDPQKRQITIQILNVIKFLHKLGIVHRDIKSHNILLNGFLQAKICDFGLAKHKVEGVYIVVWVEYWAYAIQWDTNLYGTWALT